MAVSKKKILLAGVLVVVTIGFARITCSKASAEAKSVEVAENALDRGHRLVQLMGCNDCHTPGYPESGGTMPKKKWLEGSTFGWVGPWGTTYATNLRNYFQSMTEDQWVVAARSMKSRPPMPSFTIQVMKDQELRDMYLFIKSLGASGKEAPAYLPPGVIPKTPYFTLNFPAAP